MICILILIVINILSKEIIWIDSIAGNDNDVGNETLPKNSLKAVLVDELTNKTEVFIHLKIGIYKVSMINLNNQTLYLQSNVDVEIISDSNFFSCFYLNNSLLISDRIVYVFDGGSTPILNFVGSGKSVACGLKIIYRNKTHSVGNIVIVVENGYGALENVSFGGLFIDVRDNSICGLVVLKDLVKGLLCVNCLFYGNVIDGRKGSVIFVDHNNGYFSILFYFYN
jgi:hypothetical protein